ncbi:MAG: alpha/beta fold hydrolase [Woeseiaceae bacterium]|nr:alpha/beta fold hydrolase [Woeseiaceae bacterium]
MARPTDPLRAAGALFSITLLAVSGCGEAPPDAPAAPDTTGPALTAAEQIVAMLEDPAPYHSVPPELFAELGWDLPDGGATVTALADAAPGGAFDPRALETIPADVLGYTAEWHEVRFETYGLDWDIGGLELTPATGGENLPTMVIINGGAANWYEFFIGSKNEPGLAQYLAQRVPVLLVTIPGNYRHGGWPGTDFGERIPAYLLDRDVSAEEAKIRNAIYTFRVVANGVEALVNEALEGPIVMIGHSTGGELQFILKDALADRLRGLSMGWGTGGPAGLESMQAFRGRRTIDEYPHVSQLRARTSDQYSRGYLGPLNPFWDPAKTRLEIAAEWMGAEQHRRAQFKQPLQDMEHSSMDYLKPEIAGQIRETLEGNELGIDPEAVIDDLFLTMESPVTGYEKMIWTTARLDTGHWDEDPEQARELLIADEFRAANPDIPIRVLVFDVPMTHYGHLEKPRELAGGLVAALTWLVRPDPAQ